MKKNDNDAKKELDELKSKLLFKQKNGFEAEADIAAAAEYCKGYIDYLNNAKTEREAVKSAVTKGSFISLILVA